MIIFTWSPQNHDNAEDDREKEMPESVIHPQIFPLSEAIHNFVILDTPEHEDDAADNTEDQGVRKVFVDRELDKVTSEPQLSSGGHQSREDPPTYGGIYHSERNCSQESFVCWIILGMNHSEDWLYGCQ